MREWGPLSTDTLLARGKIEARQDPEKMETEAGRLETKDGVVRLVAAAVGGAGGGDGGEGLTESRAG